MSYLLFTPIESKPGARGEADILHIHPKPDRIKVVAGSVMVASAGELRLGSSPGVLLFLAPAKTLTLEGGEETIEMGRIEAVYLAVCKTSVILKSLVLCL